MGIEEYLNKYDTLSKWVVYSFEIGDGGIGDFMKFFAIFLELCIMHNIKLYLLLNNHPIHKYLKLKHSKMYINPENIQGYLTNISDIESIESYLYYIVKPQYLYTYNYSINSNITEFIKIPLNAIFEFTDEVKDGCENFKNYISIHLRLGDAYLELNKENITCHGDTRKYNEELLIKCIEENKNNSDIIFFCDNKKYKETIKSKYDFIKITNYEIGHTGLNNTPHEHILYAVRELYLLTKSYHIYIVSDSGFPLVASLFNRVPYTALFN